MKIYSINHLDELILINSCYVSIGFFDGVHLGHQKLIKKMVHDAKKSKNLSVIFTFSEKLTTQFKQSYELSSEKIKLFAFEKLGIDIVFIIQPQSPILSLTGSDFIHQVLKKINTQKVYCGRDFRFGSDLKDISMLKKELPIKEIPDITKKHQKISSSYLKQLVKEGKITLANQYMYYPYTLFATIIKGKQLGRKLNTKTANLKISDQNIHLKNGVYFGNVIYLRKVYKAMINVGINPTTDYDNKQKIEVHILNFDFDIYDQELQVIFKTFHREEQKFNSTQELQLQLQYDKKMLDKKISNKLKRKCC